MLHELYISATNGGEVRVKWRTTQPLVWATSKEICGFFFHLPLWTQVSTVGVPKNMGTLVMHEGTSASPVSKHIDLQHEPVQLEKTTSHRLTEDLLVFHNNQCVKPSLFTLFTQRRVPFNLSQRLNFTTFAHSRPLRPFWLHASVGTGLKPGWTTAFLANGQCYSADVTWCFHSLYFCKFCSHLTNTFNGFNIFEPLTRLNVEESTVNSFNSQQCLKHRLTFKVYRLKKKIIN